jgi:hypothetical protein
MARVSRSPLASAVFQAEKESSSSPEMGSRIMGGVMGDGCADGRTTWIEINEWSCGCFRRNLPLRIHPMSGIAKKTNPIYRYSPYS